MNAMQQHLLDSYRAAQRGEATPPAPYAETARTVREVRQWRRFQAVVSEPAERWWGRGGRLARATAALLAHGPRPLDGGPAGPARPVAGRLPAEHDGRHRAGTARA
ncbi:MULTISPECIES: hypothetical protein [Streptomyces]|uniref:hypothetical protein n=1 Tax=Streptomyces TaxID=1883 RepID=UPI0019663D92|nr:MULTISPECIES: hypothetical protein [Streptomyces]QRX93594.1 hypothetical protein JNO44_24550 [Streptomyces noursei]UJB43271.1 hypothetical protein HRD51_22880 [Streptomyces sp. A1-5]